MNPDRSWMYNRNNPGRAGMIPEFAEGVTRFINHAMTLDDFLNSRLIRCPSVNCENVRYHTTETVAMHLMMNGFYLLRIRTDHLHKKKTRIFGNRVLVNRLEVQSMAIQKRRIRRRSLGIVVHHPQALMAGIKRQYLQWIVR